MTTREQPAREVRPSPRLAVMMDVARLAGVSHQTVSRVLNDHANVRPADPRAGAGGDAGVGLPAQFGRPHAGHPALTHAGHRHLRQHAVRPGVDGLRHRAGGPRGRLLRQHRQRPVAQPALGAGGGEPAAGAGGRGHRRDRAQRFAALPPCRRCPMASRWSASASAGPTTCPMVGVDNVGGAAIVTRHLLELGPRDGAPHLRPARLARGPSTQRRLARGSGQRRGRGARRVGWRLERAVRLPDGATAGRRPERHGRSSAGNDHMALGALRALSEVGRKVPHQVSVVGFDDIPEAPFMIPPLTTVQQDFGEVGRRSMELLVDIANGGHPASTRSAWLPPSRSTRVPRAPLPTHPPNRARDGATWPAHA